MTDHTADFEIVWQRRLRRRLDDRLAAELGSRLQLRVRSLERRERVVALRTIDETSGTTFLSLEDDGFDNMILRLVGQPSNVGDINRVIRATEAALDTIEDFDSEEGFAFGTPLWAPYAERLSSEVFGLVRHDVDANVASTDAHWVARAPRPSGVQQIASLGVAVESIDLTVDLAERAGGSLIGRPVVEPTGRYAVVADSTNAPLLLWEPPGDYVTPAVRGWAMCTTRLIGEVASFYATVFGWRTQVLRGGPPMAALWVRGDSHVGLLLEDRELDRESLWDVAITVSEATGLVNAARARGLTVRSDTLSPVPGRRWTISGNDGYELLLVATPQPRELEPLAAWRGLPTADLVLLSDLRAALLSAEELLRGVPATPSQDSGEVATWLGALLRDEMNPVAARLLDRLETSDQPALVLAGAAALRPLAQGLSDELHAMVRLVDNLRVTAAYTDARSSLMRLGIVEEWPEARDDARVST